MRLPVSQPRSVSLALLVSCVLAACGGGTEEAAEPAAAMRHAADMPSTATAGHVAEAAGTEPALAVELQQASASLMAPTAAPAHLGVEAEQTKAETELTSDAAEAPLAQATVAGVPTAKKPAALAPEAVSVTGGTGSPAVVVTTTTTQTVATNVSLLRLATLSTPAAATSAMIGAPSQCREGFLPTSVPVATRPAPLPAGGGATYSARDVARWSVRVGATFAQDFGGDGGRIRSNAQSFVNSGEPVPTAATRPTAGMKARDAAFMYRATGQAQYLSAVKQYLLSSASAAANDFTAFCFRELDGTSPRDAYFEHASWMVRYIVAYDFARHGMSESERLQVENYIRRQSYFFAAHLDWNLRMIFPNRLQGDYSARGRDAKPAKAADTWAVRRFDTNADCKIDSSDDAQSYAVHAYVDGAGRNGPQLSRLSQWYNNRKSDAVIAFGAAGLVLGDEVLVGRAKRYVMEWLTYGVWADGSEGEYFRNGDYCIAKQGAIYSQNNIQAGALMAHWLNLAGDASLARFSTRDGLFGTEVTGADTGKKSLSGVIGTALGLLTGDIKRYYHEPWKGSQNPREATSLGRMESNYLNAARTTDNYHELGLLLAADTFADVPIRRVVLREGIALRRPGSTGNWVTTGWGQWMDVFGAYPGVLLLQ